MNKLVSIVLLDEVKIFLAALDEKTRSKILENMFATRTRRDPDLFKKLTSTIWEFRTLYNKKHYRLFAFWDKQGSDTLVIATHGIIKKTDKTPLSELSRADRIMKNYFDRKSSL